MSILTSIKDAGLPFIKKYWTEILYVCFAVVVAIICIVMCLYTNAYAVTIDGEEWGVVADTDMVDDTVSNVENRVADILDDDYTLDRDIEYKSVFVQKSSLRDDMDTLEEELYDAVPDIMDSYVLKVDGEAVGAGNEEDLEKIIDDVKDQYTNENTIEVTVLSDVEIDYETIPSKTESEPEAISETLTTTTDPEVVHEVQDGETVADVADSEDVSVEQVITLNPYLAELLENPPEDTEDAEQAEDSDNAENIENTDIEAEEPNEETEPVESEEPAGEGLPEDVDEPENTEESADDTTVLDPLSSTAAVTDVPLEQGLVLTVEPETKLLTVQSVDHTSYEQEVAYETEQIEDDTKYVGETEVIQEGQNGTARVDEFVTKINGTETERVTDDPDVIEEPVNEIISVGTKEQESESVSENTENDTTDDTTEVETEDNVQETTETTTIYYEQNDYDVDNGGSDDGTATVTTYSNDNSSNNYSSSNSYSGSSGSYDTQAAESTQSDQSYEETYVASSGSSANDQLRNDIVNYALQFRGCAYVHGGHGPNVFDCSGLTGYVYAHFGITLPWTVEGQYAYGTYVPLDVSQMLPGDLIFWSYGGSTPTHVGMYIGGGQYIQATKPGDVVRVNTVSSYAGQPLVGCRRIIN